MLVPRARQVIGREPHLPQRRPRRGHFEALLLLKCLEEVTERDRRTIAIYSRLYGATYRDRTLAVVALAHRVVLPGPSTRMAAELRILLIGSSSARFQLAGIMHELDGKWPASVLRAMSPIQLVELAATK